jgi:hypothetical protein
MTVHTLVHGIEWERGCPQYIAMQTTSDRERGGQLDD